MVPGGVDIDILSILASQRVCEEQDHYPRITIPSHCTRLSGPGHLNTRQKTWLQPLPMEVSVGVMRARQHDKRNIAGLRFLFRFQSALGAFTVYITPLVPKQQQTIIAVD